MKRREVVHAERVDDAPQSERRAWVVALGIGVLVHVVLLAAMFLSSRNRSSPDAVQDVPMLRGMLGDSSVFGMAPEPATGPLGVSCTYTIEAANTVGRLSSGPRHAAGKPGAQLGPRHAPARQTVARPAVVPPALRTAMNDA